MDVREFKYILAIVEQGSLTKAANSLYISQPSLSAYVKKIENQLDVNLFQKKGRGLEITEAGKIYIKYARQIMDLNNSMASELAEIANKQKNRCRVGFTMTRSVDLMPQFIRRMQENYPNVTVEGVVSKTAELIEMVKEGELDLILIYKAFTNGELNWIPLHSDQIVLAVNRKNPILQYAEKMPDDDMRTIDFHYMINEPVLAFRKGNWQRSILEYLYSACGGSPKIVVEINNHMSSLAHVREDLGFATSVRSGMQRYINDEDIEFLTIKNTYPKVEFGIGFSEATGLSGSAEKAIKIIKSLFAVSSTGGMTVIQ